MLYTLKSVAKRSTLFGAAAALLAASFAQTIPVFADTLNPLTNRSLMLSSSAPGWQDTDGSGNSEAHPNNVGEEYAPPGSGPNGRKTGETFSFNVSTDSTKPAPDGTPIKGLSFQYCTTAAGTCIAPGNNAGDADHVGGSDRKSNADAYTDGDKTSDLEVVGTFTEATSTTPAAGEFVVLTSSDAGATWTQSTGWTMEAANVEDPTPGGATAASEKATGTNNMVYLKNSGDTFKPEFNDSVKIVFNASSDHYVTNPGAGAFFVKINTYKSATVTDMFPTTVDNIIDGGVTVANVMNDSIHITTKVLETMKFSVGIDNPDTDTEAHGTCDAIGLGTNNDNRLELGDQNAESSLSTERGYDVYSYWRLQSNSSAGATVYYSGDTLKNTVGDEVKAIGPSEAVSHPGTEQFGLAFVDPFLHDAGYTYDTFATNMAGDPPAWTTSETGPTGTNKFDPALATWDTDHWTGDFFNPNSGMHAPAIAPLEMNNQYDEGYGEVGNKTDSITATAKFAFDTDSLTHPVSIASENSEVLNCATAKMRYVGNIAGDTPAGVYTTKINYIAAPMY